MLNKNQEKSTHLLNNFFMEELKESVRDWTANFIEEKGGPSKVADETGLNYMVLRQIVKKERHPTWDVFVKLKKQYPKEVNLNALATGDTESDDPDSSQDYAHVGLSPEGRIQADAIAKLTTAYEKLATDMSKKMEDKDEQMKTLIKINQSLSATIENFPTVTNDTTGNLFQRKPSYTFSAWELRYPEEYYDIVDKYGVPVME